VYCLIVKCNFLFSNDLLLLLKEVAVRKTSTWTTLEQRPIEVKAPGKQPGDLTETTDIQI
jgi:hypothetical protein